MWCNGLPVQTRPHDEDEHRRGENLEDEDSLWRHACPVTFSVSVVVGHMNAVTGEESGQSDDPNSQESNGGAVVEDASERCV